MALAAGVNFWTRPEDLARESLANSAAFQTWTSTANPTAAKARAWVEQMSEPANGQDYTPAERAALYPAAIIFDNDAGARRAVADNMSASRGFACVGAVAVRFTAVAFGANGQEQLRNYKNAVGTIIEEMMAMAGQEDRFDFLTVELLTPAHYYSHDRRIGLGGAEEINSEWLFVFGFEDSE